MQFDAAKDLAPVVWADVLIIVDIAHVEAAGTDAGPAAEGVFAIFINGGRAAGGVEDAGEVLRDADQPEIDAVAAALVLPVSADARAAAVGAACGVSGAAHGAKSAVSGKIQLPAGIRVVMPLGVIRRRYAYAGKAAAAGKAVFALDREAKRRARIHLNGRRAGRRDLQVRDGDIMRSALDHNGSAARAGDGVWAGIGNLLGLALSITRLRDMDVPVCDIEFFCERGGPQAAEDQNAHHQQRDRQADEMPSYQEKPPPSQCFFPCLRKIRQHPTPPVRIWNLSHPPLQTSDTTQILKRRGICCNTSAKTGDADKENEPIPYAPTELVRGTATWPMHRIPTEQTQPLTRVFIIIKKPPFPDDFAVIGRFSVAIGQPFRMTHTVKTLFSNV